MTDFEVQGDTGRPEDEEPAAAESASDENPPGDQAAAEFAANQWTVASGQPDYQAALLVDLARAMHHAADSRHARALEEVERRRLSQVERIRERGVEEVEAARDAADRDIVGIGSWAEAEVERVRAECDERIEERRRSLQGLLDRYDEQIEWEIGAIESAVERHRADLDEFFARLHAESDVAEIARLALEAPQLPDLDEISAAARARAAAVVAGSVDRSAETRAAGLPEEAGVPVGSAVDGPELGAEDAATIERRLVGVMDLTGAAATSDPLAEESRPESQWFEPAGRRPGDEARPESHSFEPIGRRPGAEAAAAASWGEARDQDVEATTPAEADSPSGSPRDEGEAEETPALAEGVPTGSDDSRVAQPARSTSGSLLQAIPALRPVVAWLDHGDDEERPSR